MKKGIEVINNLDGPKAEHFLKRIVTKVKTKNSEYFSENEKQKLENIFNLDESNLNLAIKTTIYLFKRMLKYVFKPAYLKSSLVSMGLNNEKTELFVKLWSHEMRIFCDQFSNDLTYNFGNELKVSWMLNAELSNEYQKKIKIPKAYISFETDNNCHQDLELTHSELYSLYLQFEAIQTELDTIM